MKKLNITLVAHDSRKKELATWFKFNIDVLSQHNLFGTGTTADMILTSNLFANEDYTPIIPKSIENYKNRKL